MNFDSIFKKFTAMFVGLVFVLGFSLVISGTNSNLRLVDGSIGLLKNPAMTTGQKILKENLLKTMFSGVEVNAQWLVTVEGIGPIALTILTTFLTGLFSTFANMIVSALIQPILDFIDKGLEFIDKFIDILEKLAAFLGAFRIGLAFKVFQGLQESSNISSSKDFATELIEDSVSKGNDKMIALYLGLNSDGEQTIQDAVAWLDFIQAQRTLQADTLQDFLQQKFGVDLDYYNDLKQELIYTLAGESCDNSSLVEALGTFSALMEDNTNCFTEINNRFGSKIRERENLVSSLASAKLQTFEAAAPSDCKARSYIKYEGASFNYQKGKLADNIMTVAEKIEIISPTPEECEIAKTGNRERRDTIRDVSQTPSNIGDVLKNALKTLVDSLKDIWEKLKSSIEERFLKIQDLLNNIDLNNIGLKFIDLNISVNIGSQIMENLQNLQKELDEQIIITDPTLPNDDVILIDPIAYIPSLTV
jgi:hypothetical protein